MTLADILMILVTSVNGSLMENKWQLSGGEWMLLRTSVRWLFLRHRCYHTHGVISDKTSCEQQILDALKENIWDEILCLIAEKPFVSTHSSRFRNPVIIWHFLCSTFDIYLLFSCCFLRSHQFSIKTPFNLIVFQMHVSVGWDSQTLRPRTCYL